ncbi:hypothetical protein D3C73_641460 [compost metagenome]
MNGTIHVVTVFRFHTQMAAVIAHEIYSDRRWRFYNQKCLLAPGADELRLPGIAVITLFNYGLNVSIVQRNSAVISTFRLVQSPDPYYSLNLRIDNGNRLRSG